MELLSACDVYAKELFRLRHGYPLWDPEVMPGGEVRIGDVGFICDGAFHRFFNTLSLGKGHDSEADVAPSLARLSHAEDDPNPFGLPANFEPFAFAGMRYPFIDKKGAIEAGAICSRSVRKMNIAAQVSVQGSGGGVQFECTNNRGAALVIKDAADKREWMRSRRLGHYIRKNHNSWLAHVNDTMDLDVAREDIIYVTGYVKTAEWAMAAFIQGGRSAQLTFSGSFGSAGAFLSGTMSTDISASPEYKTGPRQGIQQPMETPQLKRNQCIFLKFWKIRRRVFWTSVVMEAAAEPRDPASPSTDDECNAAAAVESDDSDVEFEEVPAASKPFDPVGYVLDYILKYSHAEAAVASVEDVYALCNNEEIPDDISAYLERVQPPIEVTEDGLGMLSFDEIALHDLIPESPGVENVDSVPPEERREDIATEGIFVERPSDILKKEDPADLDEAKPDPPADTGVVHSTEETLSDVAHDDDADNNSDAPINRNELRGHALEKQRMVISGRGGTHGSLVLQNDDITGGVRALAYSSDGKYVVTGSAQFVVAIWDAKTANRLRDCIGHDDGICALAFSPDSKEIVSGSRDRRVMIWNADTGAQRAILSGHEGEVNNVVYSPDGKLIASTSTDCTVRLWDVASGEVRSVLRGHNAIVMQVAFSSDSKRIVSASADYSARIWSTVLGEDTSRVLQGHTEIIYSIAFSPDNRRVVTSSEDASSRIWSAETGDELVILREHTGAVWSAVFSPDNKRVLSVACDGFIKVCDSYTGDLILSQEVNEGFSSSISAGAFSVDTRLCATATDTVVRLWSTETGASLATFEGHTDNVMHLWFSPDDQHLVSSSDDSTFRLWNVGTIEA